jgi:hypothetical protein
MLADLGKMLPESNLSGALLTPLKELSQYLLAVTYWCRVVVFTSMVQPSPSSIPKSTTMLLKG